MEIKKDQQAFWHNFFSFLYLGSVFLATYLLERTGKLSKEVSLFDFFILALATFRLIRLFVHDSIIEHIRQYLERHEKGFRKEISMMIDCPWCIGIWMGLLILFIYFLTPLSHFFILVLALAGAGSLIQILVWKIGLDSWKIEHIKTAPPKSPDMELADCNYEPR